MSEAPEHEAALSYRSRLNQAQLEVLKWVSEGCPDGRYEGYSHRVSAAALRSRGLIQITGRGSTWAAKVTPRGKAVLESPEPERQRRPGRGRVSRVEEQVGTGARTDAPKPLSKTEQLISDIVAAGGVLRVPYWRQEGQPDYRQRALAAIRFGKVPLGQRLVMAHTRDGREVELELRLEDSPAALDLAVQMIAVPARLTKPHPVAARYRDRTDDHEVSRAKLSRSVRILHAIAIEAERRGYQVSSPDSHPGDRSSERSGGAAVVHLVVTIRGHAYKLAISEGKVGRRGDWEDAKRRDEAFRLRWGPSGRGGGLKPYDADATGQLSIALIGAGYTPEGRPSSWHDRKSWTLEEKLPELLYELELRAVDDDRRAAEEQRQQEERQRHWEQLMDRARMRYREAFRARELRAQAAARREARLLGEYLSDLKETHGAAVKSADWIDWVAGFIERLDPLSSPPTMPEVPEPSHKELEEFLPAGVSPYGPRRG